MTPLQLKTLHTMFSRLKKLRPDIYDDAWLRLAVRNVGRVTPDAEGRVSTKALSNIGMENVLALIEGELDKHQQQPGDYWRNTVARRTGYASRPQVREIHRLAPAQQYDLRALCLRFSNGHAGAPELLTPNQARQLIEMLKGVIARKEKSPAGVDEGGASTGKTAGDKAEFITPAEPVNQIPRNEEEPW